MRRSKNKYLKIREQSTRYGSALHFELCETKNEEGCEYIKLDKLKK
jgi:predicted metal-binding protein